jgi:hypothetical protein
MQSAKEAMCSRYQKAGEGEDERSVLSIFFGWLGERQNLLGIDPKTLPALIF